MMSPIVSIEQGKLQGKTSSDLNGDAFYSFQGIPYAKPPLGDLRFKAPQPMESWSGIRDATKEGNSCYARDMILKHIIQGSEDCLFLNVYTRHISNKDDIALKPVMVWIHGGAFRYGTSSTDYYGPEYLLTEDIVLVTLNYRLGILGFLNIEDSSLGVSPNAGMKDMVMALKWVQKNIQNFGGDPNNVTIFGESAGAASVHYLVLSPLTKGLIHRAIIQSGTAMNMFARGITNLSPQLAQALELPNVNEKEIVNKLKSLPIEELFRVSEKVLELCNIMGNPSGKTPFTPVPEQPSSEALITAHPHEIIKSGNYNKIPLIFGYTSREGMLLEIWMKPLKPQMPKNFELYIPFMLQVEPGSEIAKNIGNKIKNFYYGKPGSENDIESFYLINTDHYFLREIMHAVQRHVAVAQNPVYLYRMSVETDLNLFKKVGEITNPGVSHADDIGYLFKTKYSSPVVPGSIEEKSLKKFVKIWTNFAKFGDPNPIDDKNLKWQPVRKEALNFLDIGLELTTGVNPDKERMDFWNEIFSINPDYLS